MGDRCHIYGQFLLQLRRLENSPLPEDSTHQCDFLGGVVLCRPVCCRICPLHTSICQYICCMSPPNVYLQQK